MATIQISEGDTRIYQEKLYDILNKACKGQKRGPGEYVIMLDSCILVGFNTDDGDAVDAVIYPQDLRPVYHLKS